MKKQLHKPDLRENNGGHSIKTKFPNGFVRIGLKLRPEEKQAFGNENINDSVRAMIRQRFGIDL